MSSAVFVIVLCAALSNASWNAIVKSSSDKLATTMLVTIAGSAIALVFLPFLAPPAPASWPYLIASTGLQVVYFVLVANVYRIADMSQVYPLMRGTAPLAVALAGTLLFHESLAPGAWLGIAIVCAGILSMAVQGRGGSRAGTGIALLTAGVIASFTLIDGMGVRLSGAPLAYTLWIFLLTGPPFLAWGLLRRRADLPAYLAANWHLGLAGGAATIVSYALTMWAMTQAPIAMVAALRETAILFGVAISGLVLREDVSRARVAAAVIIACGAIALRLA